jgi:hypothetical protein
MSTKRPSKYTSKKRERDRVWARAHSKEASARMRAWEKSHPEERRETSRAWKRENPEKVHAGHVLNNAIVSGRVVRPDTCSCGSPNPQGHHSDYSKPLMVSWLCAKCHAREHVEYRLLEVMKNEPKEETTH